MMNKDKILTSLNTELFVVTYFFFVTSLICIKHTLNLIYWLIDCLFIVLRPTQEFFNYMETSAAKFRPMLNSLSLSLSLSLYIYIYIYAFFACVYDIAYYTILARCAAISHAELSFVALSDTSAIGSRQDSWRKLDKHSESIASNT
jgi:hypothetical protein